LISEEFDFWQKAGGFSNLSIVQRGSGDQQGLHLVSLTVSFKAPTAAGPRTRYVLEDQAWQKQGDAWKIVLVKHSDILKTPQPSNLNTVIYPPSADAKAEIRAALGRAAREHKHVLLIFGADWCYDCKVLDFEMHLPDFAKLMSPNFVVVHVDIGEGEKNKDLVAKYEIPAEHGVPVLAVLDGSGKLLFSDQHRQFQDARAMDPDDLMAFLEKWKP
jgi:thiol-disulfide isomerase/thioredoxin